jgi:hypothetical protein
METTKLTTDLFRRLALMQHLGEDYFIIDGIAYEGNKSDKEVEWDLCENTSAETSFADWCAENCTEVEELDPEDCNNDYLVLTDEEADEKAKDYIIDSLWAFNPSFLAEQTDMPEEVFQAIADNGKCESNNDAIERIVNKTCGLDELVSEAISADGRGHFMSSYDGNENEETVYIDDETGEALTENDTAAQTFYIYRIN